jgi:hypothetical protein
MEEDLEGEEAPATSPPTFQQRSTNLLCGHTQGKTNMATYASPKEKVIQYAQEHLKYGHDIVKSLKQGKLIDIEAEEPKRIMSTKTDVAEKASEQKGNDIKYKAELNRFMERKDTLTANVSMMFAFITGKFCTKTMLARIEEHPDYKSEIEDDLFAPLEAIKTLIHDPVRTQYFMTVATTSLARTTNICQDPT